MLSRAPFTLAEIVRGFDDANAGITAALQRTILSQRSGW